MERQLLKPACQVGGYLHHGAMAVIRRETHLAADVFELLPVCGSHGAIVVRRGVMIEVDPPLGTDLSHRWPLHPISGERLADVLPRTFEPTGESKAQFLDLGRFAFVLKHHDPTIGRADHGGVYAIEARIEPQPGWREGEPVLCRSGVNSVVVTRVAGAFGIGKAARNGA